MSGPSKGRDDGPAKPPVDVPEAFREAFARAHRYVADYFSRDTRSPAEGTIELAGERYVLVRAAALSFEFFDLVAGLYEGEDPARAHNESSAFLFDIAHAIGKADARLFHTKMRVTDPIERLSAGPIHFAYSGWAYVSILPESAPSPDDDYFLIYDHPYSFEADSWIRQGAPSELPVCVMNAGYSSGWCEESFGVSLVATEIECRAAGAEHCRFIMAPPWRITEHLKTHAPEYVDRFREAGAAAIPEFFKRKRLDEEYRRYRQYLEEEVARRTAELVEANERLQHEMEERKLRHAQLLQAQKVQAIGTLAGGIAHDFNNLLTGILTGIELALNDQAEGTPSQEVLLEAQRATEQATALSSRLLTLGRRKPYAMGATDINAVVESGAELLRRTMPSAVEIRLDIDPALPVIRADAAQLEQALINLGINARDAMPRGGRLLIETARRGVDAGQRPERAAGPDGDFVVIRVTDNGEGIPDKVRGRIFEPFFTTKAPGKGTGLGLAMVSDCLHGHQGWVDVESEPGKGSTFELHIPLIPLEPEPQLPDSFESAGGRETVLLVDDSDMVLSMGRRILERYGYTVFVANDGVDGLNRFLAEREKIDIVLTDLEMPRSNGHELLVELRAKGFGGPVLLMSGHGGQEEDRAAEGFDGVIVKPFDPASLLSGVQEVLRQ
ncbi:MAG: ATP-binding protein [Planctomycetota bacterium]|jgi:signal transduction histidine kinase